MKVPSIIIMIISGLLVLFGVVLVPSGLWRNVVFGGILVIALILVLIIEKPKKEEKK